MQAIVTTLDGYQKEAARSAVYPGWCAPMYLGLKLAGEAGEVAEEIGKAMRARTLRPVVCENCLDVSTELVDDAVRERLLRELGDVLWYTSEMARVMGYTLSDVANINLFKLHQREAEGTLISR